MSRYNIKVLGVGGGGSNTIDYIIDSGMEKVTTYAVNTDAQALEQSKAQKKIHIGQVSTNGLGAGALPEVGRKAAEESTEELVNELRGADIVFVAAGMGGGTGTGAAPYIASIAKQMGILTIGIVTKPFKFEGPSRMEMAHEGLRQFDNASDITIVIPNEKLVQNHRDKFIEDAFVLPDDILKTAVEAIINVLESVSQFATNVDLNTLKNLLANKGLAVLGTGSSNDEDLTAVENVVQALKNAINSEILEISINGAHEFVILITANLDYLITEELDIAGQFLTNELGYSISVEIPLRHNPDFKEFERDITIIATGYEDKEFVEQITKAPTKAKFDESIFVGI